jgi:exonuclease V
MPYLPPEKRPTVITSRQGAAIPVDKVKVEGKEKILRRGEASCSGSEVNMPADEQKIHKRLEREIHPQEIIVHAVTREEVWGLRCVTGFRPSNKGFRQLTSGF